MTSKAQIHNLNKASKRVLRTRISDHVMLSGLDDLLNIFLLLHVPSPLRRLAVSMEISYLDLDDLKSSDVEQL